MLAEQQSVRAYPSPYGINAAHLLGYLSPITEDELDAGRGQDDDPRSTAPPSVGRAGVEKQYDAYLRGMPGYKRVAVDSMGRVLGDSGEVAGPRRRHPGHLDRRQGPGASSSSSSRQTIKTARADLRPGHRTATTSPTPAPSW